MKGLFFLSFFTWNISPSLLFTSSIFPHRSACCPLALLYSGVAAALNCACKAPLSFRFFSSWHGLSWLFPMLTHPLEGKELILTLPPFLTLSLFLFLSLHVLFLACAYSASLLLFRPPPLPPSAPPVHEFLRFLPHSLLLLSCFLYMLLVAYSSSPFYLHLFFCCSTCPLHYFALCTYSSPAFPLLLSLHLFSLFLHQQLWRNTDIHHCSIHLLKYCT